LKAYFASKDFSQQEKDILRAKVLSGPETEETKLLAKVIQASQPDASIKQLLWTQFTDPCSEEPQKDLMAKMKCFFNRSHLDLIEPYFTKFYDLLPTVAKTRNREFTEIFMQNLSPAFRASAEDLEHFERLLGEADQDFVRLALKKEIESVRVSQQARQLCN
jgi:hypothetical protein